MDRTAVSTLQDGIQELYHLSWPLVPALGEESLMGYCYVILRREGGFLLGIPKGLMSTEDLAVGVSNPSGVVGPSTTLIVPSVRSEAELLVPREEDIEVVVVDFGDQVLQAMSPFDPELMDSTLGFDEDPQVLPDGPALMRLAKEWISVSGAERAEFYSAEEAEVPKAKAKAKAGEKASRKAPARSSPQQVADHIRSISDLLPSMAAQLSELRDEQKRIQTIVEGQGLATPPRASQAPVSMPMQQFAGLMGSPPKVKGLNLKSPPPMPKAGFALDSHLDVQEQAEEGSASVLAAEGGGGSLALAVLEQSRALTSLVSHLQQGGDPLLDTATSSASLSSKGAMNREKLQKELSDRSGGFFLSVIQNAYKKLKPASKIPGSIAEVAATDFSMLHYLERYGFYGNARDIGIAQYALSFIIDCAIHEDWEGVKEHAALMAVGLEQAAQDGSRWDLGFQLMLLEDAPSTMWSYPRNSNLAQTGRQKAFGSLCPQKWATVALAYTREMDFIANRRVELAKKTQPAAAPAAPPAPAPKRKGKFPKAKGGGEGQMQHGEEGQ